jgi:CSLREA domain-containing protein
MLRFISGSLSVRRALSLSLIVLLLIQLILPVQSARASNPIRIVTTLEDAFESSCTETRCTLRDAISLGPGDFTVQFDPTLSGSLSLTSTLGISMDMTIQGSPTVTIDGNGNQVFMISSGSTVTLDSLKIENGDVGSNNGGAIYNLGNLTITNTTIHGSSARDGGAIFNAGILSLLNSTLEGNSAT